MLLVYFTCKNPSHNNNNQTNILLNLFFKKLQLKVFFKSIFLKKL